MTTTTDSPRLTVPGRAVAAARADGRAPSGPGLTSPGGLVLGGLLVAVGSAVDLLLGGELGLGFTLTFLLTCVLVALALRVRALWTAVIAPPLLFATASAVAALVADGAHGVRRLALDVAMPLALSAPVLFGGTAAAAAIAVARALTGRAAATRAAATGQERAAAFMSRRSSGGSANSRLSSAERTSRTSP